MPANSKPSPEVRLLLLLCRHPAERIDSADATQLSSSVNDWDRFLQLAAHHRVASLVAKNAPVFHLPPHVVDQLRTRAASNAVEVFRFLTEVRRLLELLASAGIEATVLKGVPLSLQAFGDVATRDVGDVDLLIQPEQAEAADLLLQANRFVRKDPAVKLTPRRRASYSRHFKDYTYEPASMQSAGGFEVDLHWRLFRNPQMPGNQTLAKVTETITAGSLRLKTLQRTAQLLYLAVQGALDGWTRFKAVADIAALWNAIPDSGEASALAKECGVFPHLHAALLLAEAWIGGLDLPESLRSQSFGLCQGIVQHAQHAMASSNYLPELRDTSSWSMKRYEASLHGALGYKWGIARRVLFRPRVWNLFDLPDPLFPLYPLLSPAEWLLFHGAKGRKKKL
jgi:hypothetical protein